MRKMELVDYERVAKRVGDCLICHAHHIARRCYMWRHGALPSTIAVCHTCDNPNCINDAHHFAGTWGDNVRDAVAKGRHACLRRGDQSGRHILTEAQARYVKSSDLSGVELSRIYGVCPAAISKIRRGVNWGWL